MCTAGRTRPVQGEEDNIDQRLLSLRLDEPRKKKTPKSPDFILIKRTQRHQFLPGYTKQKDTDKFHLLFNVRDYKQDEIKVRKTDHFIEVTCEQPEKRGDGGHATRRYVRRCPIPRGVRLRALKAGVTAGSYLSVTAPMKSQQLPADPNAMGENIQEVPSTPPRHQPFTLSKILTGEGEEDKVVTICFRWNPKEDKIDPSFMCITEDNPAGSSLDSTSGQAEMEEDPALNNNTVPTNMNLALSTGDIPTSAEAVAQPSAMEQDEETPPAPE